MKVITGRVIDGKVELSGEVPDGTRVAVLADDDGESFRLTAAEEDELAAALRDIQSGQFVDGLDLLGDLRRRQSG